MTVEQLAYPIDTCVFKMKIETPKQWVKSMFTLPLVYLTIYLLEEINVKCFYKVFKILERGVRKTWTQ